MKTITGQNLSIEKKNNCVVPHCLPCNILYIFVLDKCEAQFVIVIQYGASYHNRYIEKSFSSYGKRSVPL